MSGTASSGSGKMCRRLLRTLRRAVAGAGWSPLGAGELSSLNLANWLCGHTVRILPDEIGGVLNCKFSCLLQPQTQSLLNGKSAWLRSNFSRQKQNASDKTDQSSTELKFCRVEQLTDSMICSFDNVFPRIKLQVLAADSHICAQVSRR